MGNIKIGRKRLIPVCLVLLFLLLVGLAPLLISTEKICDLIIEHVEHSTGAEVSLGKASIRLWPRLSVAINDGLIEGTGQQLARASGSQNNLGKFNVGIGRLEIDLALGPLLRKQIETGTIRLQQPVVVIQTRAVVPRGNEGTGQVDETGDERATEQFHESVDMSWGLAIAAIEVRDGSLEWNEIGSAKRVAVPAGTRM